VDVLEDMHLIRGEWRAGARWYELVHDRFIEPIQMSNDAWRARHKGLMAQLTALMAPLIVRMPRLSPPQTLTIRRLSCLVWALALLSALAIIAAVLGWMR
jgi:hypothetical protein